jgi:hypothetical protein
LNTKHLSSSILDSRTFSLPLFYPIAIHLLRLAVSGTETSDRRLNRLGVRALSVSEVLLEIDRFLFGVLELLLHLASDFEKVVTSLSSDLVVHDHSVRTKSETAGLGSLSEVRNAETDRLRVEPKHVGFYETRQKDISVPEE